jgi:hypothetical protein
MKRRNFLGSILSLPFLPCVKLDSVPISTLRESRIDIRALHLYDANLISQSTLLDIQMWGIDQVDELTRKEILNG